MKFIKVLSFLLFTALLSNAQPQYRNLIMEGGGIKGIAYGGALAEMQERGLLKDIVRVAGTSAGAIQACLLAVGYSIEEIAEIIGNTNIESFNDGGFVAYGSKRLIKQYGWFKGDSFLETLNNLIAKRTGNPDLTFAQLHSLAKSYPFRDLYVVGADLTNQTHVVFSYENYPEMRIADAVRISMSIPLYYRALWVNPEGKIIEDPKPEDNCRLFVDGGLLMNFPIGVFDHSKYIDNFEGKEGVVFNEQSIGFRLERCAQIDHEQNDKKGIAPFEIDDFGTYMSALSTIIMRNVSPAHPKDVSRTIYINDLGISPRPREVPKSEKDLMMLAGRQAVNEFMVRFH